ncbi:MAG: response regulator transcription factor [Pseudohongiella sp.]|nr:response regulator transcription factor [Pseudohongiella sp.]
MTESNDPSNSWHSLYAGAGVKQVQYGLIVEDLPDAREWLIAAMGNAFPGVSIATAASLADARSQIAVQLPQIALIDIGLPDGSGIDLIDELNQTHNEVMSIVTSVFDDDTHLFAALGAGASGYLLKDQSRDELTDMLKRIVEGQPPLSPAIARRLLGFFGPRQNSVPAPDPAQDAQALETVYLTAREQDVLGLIAKGYTTPKVGELLNISKNTAAGYVKSIYAKLNISSRAEAAMEASRRGIVSQDAF